MAITLGPETNENSIYAIVRRLVKDNPSAPSAYSSDAIIKALATEVMAEIATLTRSRRKSNYTSGTATAASTRTFSKPSDCMEIITVYWGTALDSVNALIHGSEDELILSGGEGWFTKTGTPKRWYEDDDKICLYPIPSATGYIAYKYVTLPAALSDNADVPDIDPRLHYCLCLGIAAEILDDMEKKVLAEVMRGRYEKKIAIYQSSRGTKRRPSQMLSNVRGRFA